MLNTGERLLTLTTAQLQELFNARIQTLGLIPTMLVPFCAGHSAQPIQQSAIARYSTPASNALLTWASSLVGLFQILVPAGGAPGSTQTQKRVSAIGASAVYWPTTVADCYQGAPPVSNSTNLNPVIPFAPSMDPDG